MQNNDNAQCTSDYQLVRFYPKIKLYKQRQPKNWLIHVEAKHIYIVATAAQYCNKKLPKSLFHDFYVQI